MMPIRSEPTSKAGRDHRQALNAPELRSRYGTEAEKEREKTLARQAKQYTEALRSAHKSSCAP